AVQLLSRLDRARRHASRQREDLHAGAGLEAVTQAAVAPLRRLALPVVVRVVARPARHGEDRAGVRLDDDDAGARRLIGPRGSGELALSDELDALVNGQVDAVACQRLLVADAVSEQQAPGAIAQARQLLDVPR